MALVAGLLPITLLGDLISLGTATSFAIVCFSVMWLRNAEPDLPRPFRVPLGGLRIGGRWIGVVPVLGMIMCLVMVTPLAWDIAGKAVRGDWLPAGLLIGLSGGRRPALLVLRAPPFASRTRSGTACHAGRLS